jgi:pyruvate/2-oxoglutarate/acetoin dehydrogenase E1 component
MGSTSVASRDPWHRNRLIRDGILRAIQERMAVDESVYMLGEGAGMKTHFDAPEIERLYPHRVITLPISEDANTNFAVGLALQGCLPIVDVISSDFLYRTMDSICNTVAKVNYVHDEPKTIIIRAEFMTGGPTSGQRIESLFAHIPGLRVVVPSNPRDAYSLMVHSLNYKGATVFFEDRMIEDATTRQQDRLDGSSADFRYSMLPHESFEPILTVVSYGISLRHVLPFYNETPIDLFDLAVLWPLDVDSVVRSVIRTGNLLIVEPDVLFGGIGAELAAQVIERVPCRVRRLGAPRTTIPACRDLHERMLPSLEAVKKVATELLVLR